MKTEVHEDIICGTHTPLTLIHGDTGAFVLSCFRAFVLELRTVGRSVGRSVGGGSVYAALTPFYLHRVRLWKIPVHVSVLFPLFFVFCDAPLHL